MSPGRRERGRTLTFERARADNGCVSSRRRAPLRILSRRLRGERGQAMVEFALLAPLFLVIVTGILQFGLALNQWLQMQNIAGQGVRLAVVNQYPGCARTRTPIGSCAPTLQEFLKSQALSQGLKDSVCVDVSFPETTTTLGSPVKVHLQAPFTLLPILNIGTITLSADATERLEWDVSPGKGQYSTAGNTC